MATATPRGAIALRRIVVLVVLAAAVVVVASHRASGQPGTTERISLGIGGVQGNSDSNEAPAFSADGRIVAFSSMASNLVAGDTNAHTDVFVRDRQAGTTERVSLGPGGVQANGDSGRPAVSADGRFVAFDSTATNLVTGDTNGVGDIFVYDRQNRTTERVSVATGGTQGTARSMKPSISGDGRFVAFTSMAQELAPQPGNCCNDDVFLHDRATGTTTLISVKGGVDGTISSDGGFVAYVGSCNELEASCTNTVGQQIFIRDLSAGVTRQVTRSKSSSGGKSNPALSGDGSVVVFEAAADDLVPGDTNQVPDVFAADLQTGAITRMSVASGGAEGNASSADTLGEGPAISGDGQLVAFVSAATNLVTGDTNGVRDVFVHDRLTGQTTRESVATDGSQGAFMSTGAALSADGHWVGFASNTATFVPADTNGHRDVFAHYLTGSTPPPTTTVAPTTTSTTVPPTTTSTTVAPTTTTTVAPTTTTTVAPTTTTVAPTTTTTVASTTTTTVAPTTTTSTTVASTTTTTVAPTTTTVAPTPGATTLHLTSRPNPSRFGQPVTFTATVASKAAGDPTPAGTVTFVDRGIAGTAAPARTLGVVPLDASGAASFTVPDLAIGERRIVATYNGSTGFTSAQGTLTQRVDPADTAVTLTSDPNPVAANTPVTFTARVVVVAPGGGPLSGTVTFRRDGVVIGTVAIDAAGVARFTTQLPPGSHAIKATFFGPFVAGPNGRVLPNSEPYNRSDASLTEIVTSTGDPKPATTVAVSLTPSGTVLGQAVTVSVQVSPAVAGSPTPTGSVTLLDRGNSHHPANILLAVVPLDANGRASWTTRQLDAGDHEIRATYNGSATYNPSSGAKVESVHPADTTVTLSTNPNPAAVHSPLTLTASVALVAPAAGTPVGTVAFESDHVLVGRAIVGPDGVATLQTDALTAGSHVLVARFTGALPSGRGPSAVPSDYNRSASAPLTQVISAPTDSKAPAAVSLALTPGRAVTGQAVTITATVSAVTAGSPVPTGTVTLFDAGPPHSHSPATLLGVLTLDAGGTVTLTTDEVTAPDPSGLVDHQVTAAYNGSPSYAAASATRVETVEPAHTTVTLTTDPNPSAVRTPVTLRAVVAPVAPGGGVPSGIVVFVADGKVFGHTTLDGSGVAVFTTETLTAGSHTLTARYVGPPPPTPRRSASPTPYVVSTSAPVTHTVVA